jgi:outer membrane protein assembly factor BamB
VLYAQRRGSLEVVALNARDGSTAWIAPASPSYITAGVSAELAVRAGEVFYLQAVGAPGEGIARVVARDVSSGKVSWQSSIGTFQTWPEICPDQTNAVCVNGTIEGARGGQLRFSATSGTLVSVVRMGSSSFPGREIAPDLFDPGQRNPEQILAVERGRVAWRSRLSAIFTLPRASTDAGWNIDRVGRLGLFVGSVAERPTITGGKAVAKLSPTMTVGFSTAAGRAAWRASGYYSCGEPLPCPGRNEAGYTSSSTYSSPSVGIRLLEKGTATFPVHGGKPKFSRNASVVIQGFNPATGKARWSFKAGRNVPLLSELSIPPQTEATTVVLKTRSGDVALDLRTGRTKRLSSASRAWCRRTIIYHLAHSGYYRGGRGMFVGQQALFPCTLSARRAATPASLPRLVRLIGASTDGMTAWTDTRAVHAKPN